MFPSLAKKIHELTNEPDNRKSLDIAIETANELISLLDPRASNLKAGEDALDENIPVNKFPNYKAESWFAQHPYFTGERVALNFYESDVAQIKFYWLGDTATKARVSAGVMLTPNWEDSDLTRNDQYKVGIDFFLSANTKSLLMVVSNNGNLRILEFNDHLSNTQHDILKNLRGVLALDTKDQIHKTLWDALALSEVNKKFYLGIAEKFYELLNHLAADGKDAEDAKLFASRLLGRLLFIWFLRRKNIIQEQYGYFEVDSYDSTEYYDQKLKKLFFKTLNTPSADRQHADDKTPYLNGGLFEAHDNDWANQKVTFPTGFFNRLYEHLEQYNFTTDESSPEYEQVAIDPEMLGRVFESLLATQVNETGDQARKAKGAFYTPREIVAYMCKESLRQHLYTKLDNESLNEGVDKLIDTTDSEWEIQHSNAKRNLWGDKDRITVPAQVLRALDDIKILDPACGSGAFPMGMLQLMLKMYERLDNRFDIYKTKLRIVQENIYGVDIEPMAVEISRLRAWLSLVVDDEDDSRVEPLPNLDFKFVCANSLLPLEQQTGLFADASLHEKLAEVRTKFFNARVPSSKNRWKAEYYKLTGNGQNSFLSDQRESQLRSFDPFKNSHPASFFNTDYMFGIPSFDVVIGNPPYVGEKGNKIIFDKLKNNSFGKRFYKRKMDLFYFFFSLGVDALKENGVLTFITTNYYPTADGAVKLRKDFYERTNIIRLINFGEITIFESAKGQHNLITILEKREKSDPDFTTQQIVARQKGSVDSMELDMVLRGESSLVSLAEVNKRAVYDDVGVNYYIRFASNSNGADGMLDKIASKGRPLESYAAINMGVQTGADTIGKALLRKYESDGGNSPYSIGERIYLLDNIEGYDESEKRDVLRKYIKGSAINRYCIDLSRHEWIIYADSHVDISRYPNILQHLSRYRDILAYREQVNTSDDAWFRIRGAKRKYFVNTGKHIVTPYRSKTNRFAITDGSTYGAGDVYFLTNIDSADLYWLLGTLNSKLVHFWLYNRGKRKGEMLEFYQTPLSHIPIAAGDARQKQTIDHLVRQIIAIKADDKDANTANLEIQVDHLVYEIYGLSPDEVSIVEAI